MFGLYAGYFWGPMPIMIWIAILVELVKASIESDQAEGWSDFAVLVILQAVNGIVGYVEEKNAGDAIQALKDRLAQQCRVLRDGRWLNDYPARELVPGDVIQLDIGKVVPADCIITGNDSLGVDQAALTGESLPVTKYPNDKLFMGSTIKEGKATCVVVGTGSHTFFGSAASLMNIKDTRGRFQKILFKITLTLLTLSVILVLAIFVSCAMYWSVQTVT